MLVALTRRRSLLVAVALAVAIGALIVPAVAGSHGHCIGSTEQHCAPALPSVGRLPGLDRSDWVEAAPLAAFPPQVPRLILKVPLSA